MVVALGTRLLCSIHGRRFWSTPTRRRFQLWSGVLEIGGYDVIVEPLDR